MLHQRVALFAVALYMLAGFAYCSRCDISQPGRNCLTLWMAFQDSLVSQRSNLLRLDLMFNQPSRLTPTVVKVIYNYSITSLDDCNSTCVDSNCSVVLGWTAKSLYRYFHVSVINQLRFQLLFLIINSLEGSELREEPDVNDYLWVGDDQTSLPELYLTLDITFTPENNTLDGCPSNEDITNALGELNHWIRAFAKVALQGPEGLHNVNPDYKGYTLPQSGVEPYFYHESNKDSNELIGQTLFVYMYVTNAVVALIVGIFILPLPLKVYDRAAKKNDKFFRDSTRIQLFMVTLLASVYIGAVYIADMYYYIKISYKYFNLFLILKLLFEVLVLVILLFWSFYIVFNIIRCYRTEGEDRKTVLVRISQIAVIVPLALALILVMLSVFPTLLLLFAHPMNTFSLIGVALFYTETMAGVLFMDQLYMCKQACTIGEWLRNGYDLLCTFGQWLYKACLNCTRNTTFSTIPSSDASTCSNELDELSSPEVGTVEEIQETQQTRTEDYNVTLPLFE